MSQAETNINDINISYEMIDHVSQDSVYLSDQDYKQKNIPVLNNESDLKINDNDQSDSEVMDISSDSLDKCHEAYIDQEDDSPKDDEFDEYDSETISSDISIKLRKKQKIIKKTRKYQKKAWSCDEDVLLKKIVDQFGPKRWNNIAGQIDKRTWKQCRQRWYDHLDPQYTNEPWNDSEEWILYLGNKYFQNQWSKITSFLKGRTDNNIRNHWSSKIKKKIVNFDQRYNDIQGRSNPSYLLLKRYQNKEKYLLEKLSVLSEKKNEIFKIDEENIQIEQHLSQSSDETILPEEKMEEKVQTTIILQLPPTEQFKLNPFNLLRANYRVIINRPKSIYSTIVQLQ